MIGLYEWHVSLARSCEGSFVDDHVNNLVRAHVSLHSELRRMLTASHLSPEDALWGTGLKRNVRAPQEPL